MKHNAFGHVCFFPPFVGALSPSGDGDSRGTAMLEFALSISVLLLLVSGVADYWKMVRESDVLISASRHGARSAGALAFDVVAGTGEANACSDDSGNSPVLTSAANLTYNHLVASSLESGSCTPSGTGTRRCAGNSFTVTSQFETVCEDGFAQQAVRVSITANGTPRCFFCFLPALRDVTLRTSSVFPVEADCSSTGALVCP